MKALFILLIVLNFVSLYFRISNARKFRKFISDYKQPPAPAAVASVDLPSLIFTNNLVVCSLNGSTAIRIDNNFVSVGDLTPLGSIVKIFRNGAKIKRFDNSEFYLINWQTNPTIVQSTNHFNTLFK